MPAGRPTTYDPAFCEKVLELGEQGASKHEMALEIGCHWDTFCEWQKVHGEFSDAVKLAAMKSQGWWEREGRKATFGGVNGFNATSFIFNMKNRFPEYWRDKRENELSGTLTLNHEEALSELQ